jgi:transglutaminase-like putative cysteine protease
LGGEIYFYHEFTIPLTFDRGLGLLLNYSTELFNAAPTMPNSHAVLPHGRSSRSANSRLTHQTVRPIGAYALSGLAVEPKRVGHRAALFAVDQIRGYLLEIDPDSQNATILNPQQVRDWIGATGLAIDADRCWFANGHQVWTSDRQSLASTVFAELPYPVDGVAVWESMVYVTCQKSGYIHLFDRDTGKLSAKWPQPGVGQENLTVTEAGVWVCDRVEQTVYCLDRTTGAIQYSALTPFPNPTAIAFYPQGKGQAPLCYVAYTAEEPYIRDDPNGDSPYQLTFRDRTWIHPLHIDHQIDAHYTRSNGYLVELSYVEELLPLETVTLNNATWRIALPSNTLRQQVRQIEPIGQPFTIEEQDGQSVAVFQFDQLQPHQAGIFGWKAVVEMYSLKYHLTPADVEDAPPLPVEMQGYLVDDDDLMMDQPSIRQAAKEAVGTETNLLRKMLKIRNYVYDRLSYGIQPKIDTPDVALARGIASCGEYVGVLLALARLNGIACRTIGRYKCPQHPEQRNLPLEPEFNHVWLEFYVPGIGWLPMESNVDDVIDRGPYPERFFMGLAWYHMEIGKGISFEKLRADDLPEHISLGDLAINHIRFTILDELLPTPIATQKSAQKSALLPAKS